MPMGLGKCYGVYDPALECWATMGPLPNLQLPRHFHNRRQPTQLRNNEVLTKNLIEYVWAFFCNLNQRCGCPARLPSTLLPILQGSNRNAEKLRKLCLGKPCFFSSFGNRRSSNIENVDSADISRFNASHSI